MERIGTSLGVWMERVSAPPRQSPEEHMNYHVKFNGKVKVNNTYVIFVHKPVKKEKER